MYNESYIHSFSTSIESSSHFQFFYILRKLVRVSVSHRERYDFPGDDSGTTWCNAVYSHRCEHTEKFGWRWSIPSIPFSIPPSRYSRRLLVSGIARSGHYKSIRGSSRSCLAVVLRHTWANRMQHRKATSWYDTIHQGRSLRDAIITVSAYFQNQKFMWYVREFKSLKRTY